MRIGTPLGEYRFEFRRLERRDRGVAIVGDLAGFEASVGLGPEDATAVLRLVAPPLAAALLVAYVCRR